MPSVAAGLVGVGREEAFQLLWNASAIFYGLTYLVMFAIPIIGLRDAEERTAPWIRCAAASGFLMTLLYVTLSVLPIVSVSSSPAAARGRGTRQRTSRFTIGSSA